MKPFSLKFMHFDIQHNTLQIKHKKNCFFFLFYNNQNTWKMNQKSVIFSSSPHRWVYFLLHLKYSINCKSCRNMNNIYLLHIVHSTKCWIPFLTLKNTMQSQLHKILATERYMCLTNVKPSWSLHYNISQDLMKSKDNTI